MSLRPALILGLALGVVPPLANRRLLNVLSATGLAMMLFSILAYSSATSFPGIAAAVPTLGTALIIYTGIGNETTVNRLLSARPSSLRRLTTSMNPCAASVRRKLATVSWRISKCRRDPRGEAASRE